MAMFTCFFPYAKNVKEDETAKMANADEKKGADTMDINTNMISDGLKTMANVTDLLTKKKEEGGDISNSQPHQQQVQVVVGDQEKKDPKPMILREKHETHIHKEFPDNRAMTDAECELALKKAQMEHELKLKEMEYQREKDERDRRDRIEREERERQQQKENEKFAGKVLKWGLGVIAALGLGYGGYRGYRAWKGIPSKGFLPDPGETLTISNKQNGDYFKISNAEGKVE